jgi:uncharacterized protein (DUF58 family)
MSTALGWALAVVAVAIGYVQWGWAGVVLAITLIAFWLLLQFSRALRALRAAGQAPVGQIDNAVMLHAKLHAGQRLPEILKVTRSLGIKVSDQPEVFEWRDAAGDAVRIELVRGKLRHWDLTRAGGEPQPG